MKQPFAITAFACTLAVAQDCINVSGCYLFAGRGKECRIDLGERLMAYPIPFAGSDRLPKTIEANTEIEFKQLGCEAIHLVFQDATGNLASSTISLLPDREINGRVNFTKNAISWKERQEYESEISGGRPANYRLSGSFKFTRTPDKNLQLYARYERREWIYQWPDPHVDRMEVDCQLKRLK